MEKQLPTIGISIGDLNGIGAEVILKTFKDERMFNFCKVVVFGSLKALEFHAKKLNLGRFPFRSIPDATEAVAKQINVINCFEMPEMELGKENEAMGKLALTALEAAGAAAMEGQIDAIVTAPVNKNLIHQHKSDFVGQTEFYTKLTNSYNSLMLMTSGDFRVGLVTNHLPIKEVAEAITIDAITEKIGVMHRCLIQDYLIEKPRIAVLSLNPHVGDKGVIGEEDETIVMPALEKARQERRIVFGPYAADSFFGTGIYKKFDAILAMYHDQGLVPFKAISFGEGVNVTGGLPIVRTSPDHGTAYDIAGKNLADASSMRSAIFEAIAIVRDRMAHKEMHKNPIKKNDPSKLRDTRSDGRMTTVRRGDDRRSSSDRGGKLQTRTNSDKAREKESKSAPPPPEQKKEDFKSDKQD